MRTKPASTIGEIGAGEGLSATASASGDRGCGFAAAREPARKRSMTAAALVALKDGRRSLSGMLTPLLAPTQRGRGGGAFSLNAWKFLGKNSQKRLIGVLKNLLTPAGGMQIRQGGLVGGQHAVDHAFDRK
jgi:hypothetical protein